MMILFSFLIGAQDQQISADSALIILEEGNGRFAANEPRHPHEASQWRERLEQGQHPFAIVLGCSDSRVPPELVFDQGFGDLFVIRIAGNVVDTDAIASVEYATEHLGTALVLVLGHTHCGAVTATLEYLHDPEDEPAEIVSLLYQIEPALVTVEPWKTKEDRVMDGIINNIEMGVRRLSRVPAVHRRIKTGQVKVLGAIYDIHDGSVRLLRR